MLHFHSYGTAESDRNRQWGRQFSLSKDKVNLRLRFRSQQTNPAHIPALHWSSTPNGGAVPKFPDSFAVAHQERYLENSARLLQGTACDTVLFLLELTRRHSASCS